MRNSIISIAFVALFSNVLAQNPLKGNWMWETPNEVQEISFGEKEYTVTFKVEGKDSLIRVPIAKIIPGKAFGKFITVFKQELQTDYYVNYFFDQTKDEVKIRRGFNPFPSEEEALKEADPALQSLYTFYDRYFSKEFYAAYSKRPIMPVPDKKALMAMMENAKQAVLADKNANKPIDMQQIMNSMVEKQGFHALKSQQVFQAAMDKLMSDAEVKAKFQELIEMVK